MLRTKLLSVRFSFLLLLATVLPPVSAAPSIKTVQNAASNLAPGLPNSGIAPGAIFVVYGSGLGPATLATASAAFQVTTLSGTSVAVTAGGTTANVPLYYTSDKQVAALLPSSTPTGAASIAVTYNGQTSPAGRFNVVSNNLGIFTVDSSGGGPGIVTYPDYSLVSPQKAANCGGPNTTCGAANPGDTLILWGTGLGRITGDDTGGAGLGQNMPDLPLKLWLGGLQAKVLYQGRSGCCIGEDQIVFTVPDNVPTGCAVPLAVEITSGATQVSNNVLIPVAKGSRDCTPAEDFLGQGTAAKFAQLLSMPGSVAALGYIELDHFGDTGAGFRDQLQLGFAKITTSVASPLFALTSLDRPPLGTCAAGYNGAANPLQLVGALDGGSTFTVKGPGGTMTVTANLGDKVPLSATGAFLVPGDYTITGAGGKDVGPFTATINIPISPTLTNPAAAKSLTVSRTQPMTVTWNPNGSTGHLELVLEVYPDANTAGIVTCLVPASAGSFTIPSYVLSSLPTGGGARFSFQLGDRVGAATSSIFSAPGIDFGLAQSFIDGVILNGVTITN